MSLYDEAALKKALTGGLLPVYMLFGDDDYLIHLYEKKISGTAVGDNADFNLHIFDSPSELQPVYEAAAQLPMMSDRSCVVLKDYDISKCSGEDFERLISIISGGFDTTVFILSFSAGQIDYNPKKKGKAGSLISAVEKAGGCAVQLGFRRPEDLAKFLCGSAAKRDCRMDTLTARYLIESVGQDINTLHSELEKLIGYALGNGKIITAQTVDEICVKTVEASIYKIQNELLSGNAGRALELIGRLFDSKTEAQLIFGTMASAYNELYIARAITKSGVSATAAAGEFGYGGRAFVLERAQKNARRMTYGQLKKSMSCLEKCDRTLKSFGGAKNDRRAIEILAYELADIALNGGKR